MRVSLLWILLTSLLTCAPAVIARAQSPSSTIKQGAVTDDGLTEKIKSRIQKLGSAKNVTLVLRSGAERHGSIKSVEEDKLLLFEVDAKQLLEINYSDISKVKNGYGEARDPNGRRISPRNQFIGLTIIGVLAALLVLSVPKT